MGALPWRQARSTTMPHPMNPVSVTEGGAVRLSIVTPAYREALNLPALYERLRETFAHTPFDWDWLIHPSGLAGLPQQYRSV